MSSRPPVAVVTTVTSDAHTWNLVYLQLLLEERGWQVINLGPCTPIGLVVESLAESDVDLLLVSTVNGHGLLEAPALLDAVLHVPERVRPPVVLGGKLHTHGEVGDDEVRRLRDMGFAEVFVGETAVDTFHAYLSGFSASSTANAA
ncbi:MULTISPECIES: cobalamin B12-binding domain-containing protein [unclassified Streptomyces]|uniref:cobalamin B12-binding domain-containing protein n=1 Tax=unclassified Streptomyces TaxID=2593676 RepID=UPI000563FB84|nr:MULTISPECIES: cobalamin B12-binding domain-containing protein [unclassified Streptomyces]MYT33686.1 methylmalonyl-CoA mutase [Streptomyces sp. SID8354]